MIDMNRKKALMALGILAVLGIAFFAQLGIKPADVRIIEILEKNRGKLLGLVGVVGAGIARDENNHIVGIAVYVDDCVIDKEKIPDHLGEFKIYIKRFYEISSFEKDGMIIRNDYFHLLNVTVDKNVYRQDDTLTITVRNLSNETFTFGNSVYGAYFERWDGESWRFYTGMISLQVITSLNPKEEARITYRLDEKPFSPGKYRVISRGWIEHGEETIRIWGCVEFIVL